MGETNHEAGISNRGCAGILEIEIGSPFRNSAWRLRLSTPHVKAWFILAAFLGFAAGCTENPGNSEIEGPDSDALAIQKLNDFVASQFQANEPGGVVLVAAGDTIMLRAAFGLSNAANGSGLTVDQPLPIGSLTKSFTAAAVLRLAQAGRLSLDDDVRRYVSDAPVDGRVVTIEHLLTHTSGMPNLVENPGFFAWAQQPQNTAELLAQTEDIPFLFEPGTGFSYSDSGYILLGAVLESIGSGRWPEVVHDLVSQPLGLTSVRAADEWGEHAVIGYQYDAGVFKAAETIDWSVPHASGALVSNVDDLLTWIQTWANGKFLSKQLRDRAWSGRTLPDGTVSGYGFGWKRCEFEGHPAIQHGGYVPGFTASLLHLPEDNLTAIALLNSEGKIEASYLTRQALRLLLTGNPKITPQELTSARREQLAGKYRTAEGSIWTMAPGETPLAIALGQNRIDLEAVSSTKLCAAESDGTWCFTFKPDGESLAESVAMSLTCEPQGMADRVE